MFLTSLAEAWGTAAMFKTKFQQAKLKHKSENILAETAFSTLPSAVILNQNVTAVVRESIFWSLLPEEVSPAIHPRRRNFVQPRLQGYIQVPAGKHGSERRLRETAIPLPPCCSSGKLCCFLKCSQGCLSFQRTQVVFVLHSLIWDLIKKRKTRTPKQLK